MCQILCQILWGAFLPCTDGSTAGNDIALNLSTVHPDVWQESRETTSHFAAQKSADGGKLGETNSLHFLNLFFVKE